MSSQKSILDLAKEFDQHFSSTKSFVLSDTGVSHRLIIYWDQKELLAKQNDNSKWRKFNFEEIVWIRMIAKLRQLNVGVETIKEIKDQLFQPVTVDDVMSHSKLNETLDQVLENESDAAVLKKAFLALNKEEAKAISFPFFHLLLKRIYTEKKHFSILVALDRGIENGLSDEDSNISLSIYSPDLIEDLAQTKGYFDILSRTFISISLTELLNDSMVNINPAKLPQDLIVISEQEKIILNAIRNGYYKSITVRMDENSKPVLLEASQVKKVKMEARLYDLIHKGSYEDIEIKTQNGEVYYFKSTRKIKL